MQQYSIATEHEQQITTNVTKVGYGSAAIHKETPPLATSDSTIENHQILLAFNILP